MCYHFEEAREKTCCVLLIHCYLPKKLFREGFLHYIRQSFLIQIIKPMETPTTNQKLINWVNEFVALCKPAKVQWCDGSKEEADKLAELLKIEERRTKGKN